VPGQMPSIYPAGMGVTLHKNSRLVLQIHYPAGSAGKTDSTKLNIKLSTASLRSVFIQPPLNHGPNLVNGPLAIPANATKTFYSEYTIPNNLPVQGVSLLNVAPHAHLICKSWLVYGETPAGDTIPFIKINDWDFHWQGFYTFQKLIFFPKGSTFHGVAFYDNTSNNPHNPSNPRGGTLFHLLITRKLSRGQAKHCSGKWIHSKNNLRKRNCPGRPNIFTSGLSNMIFNWRYG